MDGIGLEWVFAIVAILVAMALVVFIELEDRLLLQNKIEYEAMQNRAKLETISYEEYKKMRLLIHHPSSLSRIEGDYAEYVAQRERQDHEEADAIRLAEEANPIENMPQLDVITSAEIAQATIKSFDASKILAVSNFLSVSDIQEAIESLHETLRPIYEDALVTHYQSKLGTADVKAEHIQPQIERCMEQGFKAILKLEELQNLIGKKPELGSSKQIKKKRTWKEISGEGS